MARASRDWKKGVMFRFGIFLLAPLIAPEGTAQERSSDLPDGYNLVWSDEFSDDGLPNSTRWHFDTEANQTGWYNNELQYYAAGRLDNARVENSVLSIIARRESLADADDYGGQRYSSARLTTRGRASWTYGFFEIRAKLPCGAGTWPAIWMLGQEGSWPDSGEIDIMEHVGNDRDIVSSTVHNRGTAGTNGDGGSVVLPTSCAQFHHYQLHWTPQALRMSVDGRLIHRYVKAGKGEDGWPYDRPHYLLLNLAIGGDMAGAVDDSIFPAVFEIDYVRVYQKPE